MSKDVYGEPEIIKEGNIIAKVYSPILTDEERERRMEEIKKACVRLVLYAERMKGNGERVFK
jgi:hypothetical protein